MTELSTRIKELEEELASLNKLAKVVEEDFFTRCRICSTEKTFFGGENYSQAGTMYTVKVYDIGSGIHRTKEYFVAD